MNFEEWEPIYKKIIEDLNFSRSRDKESAVFLESNLKYCNLEKIKNLIQGKKVIIVGNSPSLKKEIKDTNLNLEEKKIISADGACRHLLDKNIKSNIVCTDLDGAPDVACKISYKNCMSVIHAHGDNKELLKKWIDKYNFHNIIGTTQTRPFGKIHNFGGFTDGDRAAFLADHFNVESMETIGFDFNNPREKTKKKKKKLKWAKRLLRLLEKKRGEKII